MRIRSALQRAVALVAVVVAAVAVAGGVAASSAYADALTVTGIATADSGGIDVHLADSTALWVQVTVHGTDSSFVTDDLTYADDRGWFTDRPVTLGDTPLGDYPVDVDYRLASGTVQHWSGGTFHYARHDALAGIATSRAVTDYDHRTVAVTGRATTYDPQTGTTHAADDGTAVRVSWVTPDGSTSVGHSATTHTVGGRFTATVTATGNIFGATAAVVSPPAHTLAAPALAVPDVPVQTLQARVLLSSPQQVRVHAGRTTVVSGTAQRLTANDGWKPLAGAAMGLALGAPQYPGDIVHGPIANGTTSASGHFAIRMTARHTLTLQAFLRPSPYVAGETPPSVTVNVPRKGSFTHTTITLDQYGAVHAKATLHGPCSNSVVVLQYSPNGRTGWVNLGHETIQYYTDAPCPIDITKYGYVAGYYRLIHTESDALLTTVSPKIYRHRTPTRITGFTVTPLHPSATGTVTATGTLSQRPGHTWSALRNVTVVLVYRPDGDSTFYRAASGRTSSTGHFSLSSKAYGDGSWGVYYSADGTHFYTQTEQHHVDVR